MMKEIPILFKGDMVRAILEGRKTQTRRICKPRFDDKKPCEHFAPVEYDVGPSMERHCEHGSESTPCPYGVVGDRLWVRETWAHNDSWYSCVPEWKSEWKNCFKDGECTWVDYRATMTEQQKQEYIDDPWKWQPSIFMPRWACRIMLEVTGVRVERVQEITMYDARDEGCTGCAVAGAVAEYAELWDSINAKSGFGWDVNPWVWVVEFKRV